MGDSLELLFEGAVEDRMSMPMEIHPDRRGPIEIALALGVDEVGTLATINNERIVLFPLLHLGKRMPEILMIPVLELTSGWCASHGSNADGL